MANSSDWNWSSRNCSKDGSSFIKRASTSSFDSTLILFSEKKHGNVSFFSLKTTEFSVGESSFHQTKEEKEGQMFAHISSLWPPPRATPELSTRVKLFFLDFCRKFRGIVLHCPKPNILITFVFFEATHKEDTLRSPKVKGHYRTSEINSQVYPGQIRETHTRWKGQISQGTVLSLTTVRETLSVRFSRNQ